MKVRFAVPFAKIRARYDPQGKPICEAIEALGSCLDVSRLSPDSLRKRLWALPEETICLVGGYALIPPFVRTNPTGPQARGFSGHGDKDRLIPTDAPYASDPGDKAGELLPAKSISRIPDGAPLDAASFLKTLRWQAQALDLETRAGSFEEASDDLAQPARAIGRVMKESAGGSGKVALSPRDGNIGATDLTSRISAAGRIHLLLHGTSQHNEWGTLFGRAPGGKPGHDTRALSAALLDLCDLRGALAVLTSCYGAMLDNGDGHTAARSPADQVALAMLAHGAKAVFGATRSNWIDLHGAPNFGPGLSASLWRRLGEGLPAAAALRQAKRDLHDELIAGDKSDVPYGIKTLLQAHCFGHPLAQLNGS